jgi:site-specific DNA-methyltransferase (adenine-specific)
MDKLIEQGVKIDAVITDPPYGTTQCKWDSIIHFDEMWRRLKLLRNDNTPIILFGSEPFSSVLRMSNIKEYKYDWVYEKTTSTNFLNAKKQPLRNIELIHLFYKKQCLYNPQKTTGHKRKISKAIHKQNCIETDIYEKHNLSDYDSTERYPTSIIKFKTDKQKNSLHPTQKPVALLEYLIKTYTNEDDLVLDFTMGSGTTGIACLNANRKFIGIELDENYFNIAKDRINNHKQT